MKKTKLKYSSFLLLTAFIWGAAFVAQSVGMDYVGPFSFNAMRSMLGALVLLPVIYFTGRKNKNKPVSPEKQTADRRALIKGGVLCGCILFVATSAQQFGIQYTTVGKAGFITALYIVIVPVLGLFMRKKVSPAAWAGVALALVGLYLLCIGGQFTLNKGDVMIMTCAFFFSIHILVIDHFSAFVDGVKMSCVQFFVCGVLCGICMLIFETPTFAAMLACWLPIAYAGVLSCGVAYTLQIVSQKHIDPTLAALILSLESVFAVLCGWALLSERLTAREMTGCLLIFAAVVLAQLPDKENKTAAEKPAAD
jgi:drug/metabolite transporter (DMT)-like permease